MNDRAIYANANALDLPIADKSVHMIATSPPYWGLRSYDTGDNKHAELGAEKIHDCLAWARGDEPCGGCFVCNMRTWAREMWRVLRDDGVCFLNLGDSYAGGKTGRADTETRGQCENRPGKKDGDARSSVGVTAQRDVPPGLKPKDLTGIPWRVALALQADGWYLRSDIIWAKPNPMPESVTDRATKSHEYIFMLAKSQRYYFDAEAVKERGSENIKPGGKAAYTANGSTTHGIGSNTFHQMVGESGRNIRTVWTIATAPYSGAHYATWPPALVERMVKAGSSERGVCPECGKPWERVVERTREFTRPIDDNPKYLADFETTARTKVGLVGRPIIAESTTTGWRPTCDHADAAPVPAIVLDPFCGSGTTLMVARQLGRIGLGFDLSLKYLEENAAVRLGHDKLAAWGNGIKDTADYSDMPMFAGVML